jgi:hypothetical protein
LRPGIGDTVVVLLSTLEEKGEEEEGEDEELIEEESFEDSEWSPFLDFLE